MERGIASPLPHAPIEPLATRWVDAAEKPDTGGVDLAALLAEVQGLVTELQGSPAGPPGLDDLLDTGLGIDSLARMQLLLRLEQRFDVRLDDRAAQRAQTPRELLQVLQAAPRRSQGPATVAPPAAAPPPQEGATAPRQAPQTARTLAEVLLWQARVDPARVHARVLQPDGTQQLGTHARLLERACLVAGALQREGIAPGDAVALMLPTGLDFLESFMGIVLAGAVPVPIYPPLRASQLEDHLRRQAHILDNAAAVLLISDEAALPAARLLHAGAARLRAVRTVAQLQAHAASAGPVIRQPHDTALVQYTSGSTGQPKGVVLSHANLLANIRAMGRALRVTPGDVFVSWLPLYHDMGLIGAWLGSLVHGVALVLMAPQDFLGRPSRWLRAASDHRATLICAPNFAYEILATRVPADELQGLDLSHVRAALDGSEPVLAPTLERFAARFAPQGFDRRALMPVYGLAECGVGLAFPPLYRGLHVDTIDRQALRDHAQAVPLARHEAAGLGPAGAMQVVCCGSALPGHELRVVDGYGRELPDRHEGRIEFRGPSATAGYLNHPQATRSLFHGDWLDSGDLGYVVDGEIYLTTRVKDLIKRGGRNLHPYDLEVAVGALEGVRQGCVAVFGARPDAAASERVVVVAETRLAAPDARLALRQRIAGLAMQVLGTAADDIVLAPPRTVLKTSSGKIRRAECRALYEQGRLGEASRGVGTQLLRLALHAAGQRLRDPMRQARVAAEAAWMWFVFGIVAPLAAAAALLLPGPLRKRSARTLARAALAVSPLRLQLHTQDRGTGGAPAGAAVYVANHGSYLDWLVLTAVLPADVGFVAKRELSRSRLLGWGLSRMGVLFVERGEVAARVADAARLAAAVRDGRSLLVFPEGGLDRAPGLRPFHLGAFVAAAEAGVPVVPVALTGTRSALRDGSWLPRRGPVSVHVGVPLQASGAAWTEVLRLRDAAREAIARDCGEPLRP